MKFIVTKDYTSIPYDEMHRADLVVQVDHDGTTIIKSRYGINVQSNEKVRILTTPYNTTHELYTSRETDSSILTVHASIFWNAMVVNRELSKNALLRLAEAYRIQGYPEQAKRLQEESENRS